MPDDRDRISKLETALASSLASMNVLIEEVRGEQVNMKADVRALDAKFNDLDKTLAVKAAVDTLQVAEVKREATGAHQKVKDLETARTSATVEKEKSNKALYTAVAVALITGLFSVIKELINWLVG